MFANPEEELIVAESELCIDYEVDSNDDDDSALGTEGVEMKPWRRFEFQHLDGARILKEYPLQTITNIHAQDRGVPV